LTPTLRHELSHALTFDALADRPLWVREGVAMHFAGPEAADVADAESPCPTQTDLQRSGSANALAHARRRALACVERALNAGTPWWAIGKNEPQAISHGPRTPAAFPALCRQEDTFDEPVRAGQDDANRAGQREAFTEP
jgi:hypothetical protein